LPRQWAGAQCQRRRWWRRRCLHRLVDASGHRLEPGTVRRHSERTCERWRIGLRRRGRGLRDRHLQPDLSSNTRADDLGLLVRLMSSTIGWLTAEVGWIELASRGLCPARAVLVLHVGTATRRPRASRAGPTGLASRHKPTARSKLNPTDLRCSHSDACSAFLNSHVGLLIGACVSRAHRGINTNNL
jgi:hypothetical protein